MGYHDKTSEEERLTILRLKMEGKTWQEIAKATGRSKYTINTTLIKMGYERPKKEPKATTKFNVNQYDNWIAY